MSGQFDKHGNLWGTAGKGTARIRLIATLDEHWRRELRIRGVMMLVQGGFTLERAAQVLVGISLDEVLSEIGAFPDRPVRHGGVG